MFPRSHTSEKNDPRLPVHAASRGKSLLVEENLQFWSENHRTADAKLFKLEEELDVLLHCAHMIREERTQSLQNRLKYSDPSRTEATFEGVPERGYGLIDMYLNLFDKSKALEETIKAVKEECASLRSDCNYYKSKIRALSPKPKTFNLFGRKSLHSEESLLFGAAESGFPDPHAVAERIIDIDRTATSACAVIAALGAGIAYTTLFSATRGRLDLISWAFTCFVFVVMSCGALQVFSLPHHGQMARILRMEYVGSAEHRLLTLNLLVGLPLIAGFILLALSVALLDGNDPTTTTGSQLAIRAAGYLPIGFLGYFMLAIILVLLVSIAIRILTWRNALEWPMEHLPPEIRRNYPAILFGIKDKLFFLPGGQGYSMYRIKRLSRGILDHGVP